MEEQKRQGCCKQPWRQNNHIEYISTEEHTKSQIRDLIKKSKTTNAKEQLQHLEHFNVYLLHFGFESTEACGFH